MNLRYMPATYWLFGILIAVFIVQVIASVLLAPVPVVAPVGAYSIDAVYWNFALIPYRVVQGDAIWSVFTSIFLHDGIFHIFFNCFALYIFGLFLERRIGSKNLLRLFLFSGLIGSLAHIPFAYLMGPTFYIPSLGASGAIFGIFGALIVLEPHIKVVTLPIPVPLPLWQALTMFTVFAILFLPTIASDVHIAGLAVGLLFGHYFKKRLRDKDYEWRVVYQPASSANYQAKDDYAWIDEYR